MIQTAMIDSNLRICTRHHICSITWHGLAFGTANIKVAALFIPMSKMFNLQTAVLIHLKIGPAILM